MTFAARDFSRRRGVSDEHIPQWICEERATKSGRKRPAALRVAPNLACGFVARRFQPHGQGCALLAPRHRPNWAQRTSSYLCLRPLSKLHSLFWFVSVLGCCACRTVPPLAPANLSEPGWTMREGQAVWRPKTEGPEIAGELLVAIHRTGETYLQFTKTPLP